MELRKNIIQFLEQYNTKLRTSKNLEAIGAKLMPREIGRVKFNTEREKSKTMKHDSQQ